jgi:hypothetical protein
MYPTVGSHGIKPFGMFLPGIFAEIKSNGYCCRNSLESCESVQQVDVLLRKTRKRWMAIDKVDEGEDNDIVNE